MPINPILALEVRARWRSGRSYLLLLGVALSLSLLAVFVYQRALLDSGQAAFNPISGAITPAIRNDNARLGAVGRELFLALAHLNILVWLFIAAASAATGIARERERGLLESLQLSRIGASAQIAARFGANLMLLGALQLVLLPIYAVAFLMRGVAPAEVGQAFTLVAWSAMLGTSLGLWFSARSHRPTNALFGALGAIALVSGLVYFNAYTAFRGFYFTLALPDAVLLFHPNALFYALADANFTWTITPQQTLLIFSALYLILCALCLWSATRNVNRTLPPPAWQTNAEWVEKLRARQAVKASPSKASQRASGALLTDLPLDRFVKFSDPLLAREVKSRFRLRRAGFWVGLIRFALFLLAAGVWLFEVFWLFDPRSRSAMAPYGLRALLYGGTLCLGVLAATSWTRERESGTWESLKLSLMAPRQILRAKWLSPLVSFAYYASPLLVLMPVGAFYVGLGAFAAGVCVVAAWLGLAVALGLWMSWRVKNGTASLAWTAGLLMGVLVIAPWLNEAAGVNDAITKWQYGVAGWRDQNVFYGTQPISNDLGRLYQNETGRPAPKPVPLNSGRGYAYPVTWNFQQWGNRQIERAETFKARLDLWQPSEALNRLFVESDKKNTSAYRGYGARNPLYAPEDTKTATLLSTLAPLGITLILLWLLRRDIRREQLNA